MAATAGSAAAAAAATGRFLALLLLLGLTAPTAALAGYIEVGSGNERPIAGLSHPPGERGLRAGGLGASRAGRRGSGLRRARRPLPRPCVVQRRAPGGCRAASVAAEAK